MADSVTLSTQDLNDLLQAAQARQAQGGFSDTGTLASIWGVSSSEFDAVVQRGSSMQPRSRPGRPAYLPGGASPAQAAEFRRWAQGTEMVRAPQTMGELFTDFVRTSRRDPVRFQQLQQQLFVGGFYRSSVDLEDIVPGQIDDVTLEAWYNAMAWTARYNAAGEDITVDELLQERYETMLGPLREAMARSRRGGGGGGGGGGGTYQLSDPAGLAQGLNAVAREVLGRKATAEEQRMFVALIHGLQRSGTPVSPEAQAEQMLREQAPQEAAGYDMVNTFNDFLGIIGGLGVMNEVVG